jgi:hypothetical protein
MPAFSGTRTVQGDTRCLIASPDSSSRPNPGSLDGSPSWTALSTVPGLQSGPLADNDSAAASSLRYVRLLRSISCKFTKVSSLSYLPLDPLQPLVRPTSAYSACALPTHGSIGLFYGHQDRVAIRPIRQPMTPLLVAQPSLTPCVPPTSNPRCPHRQSGPCRMVGPRRRRTAYVPAHTRRWSSQCALASPG